MADPAPGKDEGKTQASIPESTLVADKREVTTNESINGQGNSQAGNRSAHSIRILRIPSKWWESLKDPGVSNRTIAIATVVIAIAAGFTWWEVHVGSKQTNKIVTASQNIQTALEAANTNNQKALSATLSQSQNSLDASLAEMKKQGSAMAEAGAASKQQAEISRESLIVTQRAFVSGEMDKPVRLKDSDWRFAARWENIGNTPARKAHNWFNCYYNTISIHSNYEYPDTGVRTGVEATIAAKGGYLNSGNIDVPIGIIKAVADKSMHLYFWGWNTYHDSFQDTPLHLTEFCVEVTDINGDLDSPSSQVAMFYTRCRTRNCTDENCEDYNKYSDKGRGEH